ncbi:MAG: hypothetical protein AAFY19_00910 [Pseudomonadota bacterium]
MNDKYEGTGNAQKALMALSALALVFSPFAFIAVYAFIAFNS